MVHRGNTKKVEQLSRDSMLIASALGKKEVGVECLAISLLRNLDLPGAQVIMEGYNGSDLIGMARKISDNSAIELAGFSPDVRVNLPHSEGYHQVWRGVTDFSRKLHHDFYASVHFPYAIAQYLNTSHSGNRSEDESRLLNVFRQESRKWNSGLTSPEYLEVATVNFLMGRGLPVYGNVKAGVEGKDLFAYENN